MSTFWEYFTPDVIFCIIIAFFVLVALCFLFRPGRRRGRSSSGSAWDDLTDGIGDSFGDGGGGGGDGGGGD